MDQQLIERIVGEVMDQLQKQEPKLSNNEIPIAVSARHVHLKPEHIEVLFGKGYELTKRSDLSQPGQFAANETVVIAGPRGSIEKVRILGPARSLSQVEVSWTDAMKLGVKPPLRESGNIARSAGITLIGPKGSLYLDEGLIVAQSHIHMEPKDADRLGVRDGDFVTIDVEGIRPISFNQVKIRVSERYRLEMHIDTDEANAGFITQGTIGKLRKPGVERSNDVVATHNEVQVPPEKKAFYFKKKLLSNEDIRAIQEDEIVVDKGTIVTALAKDTAREIGKVISIK
ncbi:phosphate propanoyltransferase [Sporosarcina contaminans]|uniref:Phosphate propanoyltransferase n=1 Tax=Sporosarcina contaminans TaxID=633403 RepID=A0ABW3TYN5_9BACL